MTSITSGKGSQGIPQCSPYPTCLTYGGGQPLAFVSMQARPGRGVLGFWHNQLYGGVQCPMYCIPSMVGVVPSYAVECIAAFTVSLACWVRVPWMVTELL